MAKYYPSTYHQVDQKTHSLNGQLKQSAVNAAIKTQIRLNRKIINTTSFPLSIFSNLPQKTRLTFNSKILEVGCGRGELLRWLQSLGFREVLGMDPHIAEENKCNVRIIRDPISKIAEDQTFDLVIFDHSFEHIKEEKETLNDVRRLLTPTGTCLIRIPVKTGYIWDKYGVNWAQIDAPRHFYLHTLKSIEILCRQAQLGINRVVFDSSEFQFWASEQYKMDIPLRSEKSYVNNPTSSMFTGDQISQYKALAAKLNGQQQGDQAAFYLTK
jgi:SAM-dependent methyltransferase